MTFDAKIIRTERKEKWANGLRVHTGSTSGRGYRGLAWQPCCMAGTIKIFCITKNILSVV